MSEETEQIEQIRQRFETDFEKFAHLRTETSNLNLADAENLLRELGELKTKHTGKKSELANSKKLIGRVAPEERGAFGSFVQSIEREITTAIEETESNLKNYIAEAKIERERLDVTLPGTRTREGHLHLLTILRQKVEDIFVSWVIRLRTTAKSKPIITTSMRSIFPKVIRRANRRTLFTRPTVSRCARRLRLFKSVQWNGAACRFALSRPAEFSAATRPI
jgi:phenylalanyl-tRNA synthetase alpha subunit